MVKGWIRHREKPCSSLHENIMLQRCSPSNYIYIYIYISFDMLGLIRGLLVRPSWQEVLSSNFCHRRKKMVFHV